MWGGGEAVRQTEKRRMTRKGDQTKNPRRKGKQAKREREGGRGKRGEQRKRAVTRGSKSPGPYLPPEGEGEDDVCNYGGREPRDPDEVQLVRHSSVPAPTARTHRHTRAHTHT